MLNIYTPKPNLYYIGQTFNIEKDKLVEVAEIVENNTELLKHCTHIIKCKDLTTSKNDEVLEDIGI